MRCRRGSWAGGHPHTYPLEPRARGALQEAAFQVDVRDGADLIENPLGEREGVVGSLVDHATVAPALSH